MSDQIGYWLPKFFTDSQDDPLVFDSDPSGLLGVQNNIPQGFLTAGFMPDAQNRLATSDGINRPRPGKDLLATIANCTRVNGICQLTGNTFLVAATVSGSAAWYSFNVATGMVTTLAGGPAFNVGNSVYMVQGLNAVYFCWQSLIWKWDGTNFTQVATQPGHPNYDIVLFFTNRVIGIEHATNIIDMSKTLDDTTWDTINLSVQLDQFIQDSIVGAIPYQNFEIIVFKNNATYLLDCNPANFVVSPSPSIANFPITIVTSVIGCCEHRTACQAGNDVIFLSESGRGVFTVGQLLANEQQAIKNPVSLPVKAYINRINWSAIHRAHAVVWDDLYILSVPLDGSTVPNFLLIFNIALQTWQGLWTGYSSDIFALQKYSGVETQLVWASQSGGLYRHWYAADQVWVDTTSSNVGTGVPFSSQLSSRGYRMGETFNKIQPFSWILEFTQSTSPVSVQLIADTNNVGPVISLNTFNPGVNLPLNLPFNLPAAGIVKQVVSARPCGQCTEFQIMLSGTGNWAVQQLSSQAWIATGGNIAQQ